MAIEQTHRDDEVAVPPATAVTRRTLLKGLGVGGATVLVAGSGVLSYRVYDTAALAPGGGHAYDPWHQWRADPGPLGAVAAAILAANPHNTQPWTFHVSDTAIDVYTDSARNLGAVDPDRREQQVGIGCALENLALACQARGLAPIVALLPDGPEGERAARVSLTPGSPQAVPLYEQIGRRHTNRGPYTSKAVSAETMTALVDSNGLPGLTVSWITHPAEMAELGQLLVDAASALTRDEAQSRASFAWYRGNNDAVQKHRDGLTLDAQGMSPLVLSVAKMLPSESRGAGDTYWVSQTRTAQTRTAAAYGVITATDPYDRTTQLLTGRLLQRIHLTATGRGVALQPMNQITERIDRERATAAIATFAPRFSALLPSGVLPVLTFRIGYPTRDARPSPRRTLKSVTR